MSVIDEIKQPSTDLAEKMAVLTCEMAKTCNEKENQFASLFNLTPAEFKCLRLFTYTKSLPIKDLCHEMNITPGRITHILTSLEGKKFITRSVDPLDKRNVIVTLTSKSEPFIKNINKNHIKIHKEILKRIDPDKRDDVILAMKQVIAALKDWSDSQK